LEIDKPAPENGKGAMPKTGTARTSSQGIQIEGIYRSHLLHRIIFYFLLVFSLSSREPKTVQRVAKKGGMGCRRHPAENSNDAGILFTRLQ
jgi:hypothetical protein